MSIQQRAAALARVGSDVANEGLIHDLVDAAMKRLEGQVPEGKEVAVSAMILAMAAGQCAAISLFGLPQKHFDDGVESLCDGIRATAKDAHTTLARMK
jgi:hypothetical protein